MNGQRELAAALLDPEQPSPTGLIAWNGSDPAARFAVYRNNVIVSLVDALANTFPVVHELVGEEFFRAMAQRFVRAEPPRSRVLAFYGESFPSFIGRFPPAASVPYLADVARLEMMRVQAYHARDAGALSVDAITQALAHADELDELLVELHPSLRLVRSPYAVVSLWAAHQGIVNISTVDPYVSEHAFVIRLELDVAVVRLDAQTGDFIACLLQGATLGDAAEHASRPDLHFNLAGAMSLLIRQQAISALTQSKRTHHDFHP